MFVNAFLLLLINAILEVKAVGKIDSTSTILNRHRYPPLMHDDTMTEVGKPRCSNITFQATFNCLTTYFKSFYIHITPHAPGFSVYEDAINGLLRSGKKGVDYVCKPMRTLNGCLEKIPDYKTCQNIHSYKKLLHQGGGDAQFYLEELLTRGYQCDHEDVLLDNLECILRADDDRMARENCIERLIADYWSGRVSHCTAIQSYARCETAIFLKECGPGISNFMCNVQHKRAETYSVKCADKLPPCAETAVLQPLSIMTTAANLFTKLWQFSRPVLFL